MRRTFLMERSPFESPPAIDEEAVEVTPQGEKLLRVVRSLRLVILALLVRNALVLFPLAHVFGYQFSTDAWSFHLKSAEAWFHTFLILFSIIACYALARQFLPRPPAVLIALTQVVACFSFLPQILLIVIAFRWLGQQDLSCGVVGLSKQALIQRLARRDELGARFP